MKIRNLKPNKINPRTMSTTKKEALKKSLEKYGDLGCIILNRKTKMLLGGHQRSDVLPRDAEIIIETEYPVPTKAYTVAIGYVEFNGERFKYREVDAPESWEREALIAANKHSGEWNNNILKKILDSSKGMDYQAMGFDNLELDNIGIEAPDFGSISNELPETFDNGFNDDPNETDAQYLKKNKGPDTEIRKERIPNNVKRSLPNEDTTPCPIKNVRPDENPFEEKPKKRHVVIVEFDNEEDKKKYKKEIKEKLEELNGYFV